jgi:hypothetical protein
MKTKLLLMLLAFTGLGWGVDRASADPARGNDSTAHLSQTIAELIGFDLDTHSLLAVAIDRALVAQAKGDVNEPRTAGVPLVPPTKKQLQIRGQIAVPSQPAIDPVPQQQLKQPQSQPSTSQPQTVDGMSRVKPTQPSPKI